MSTHLGLIVLYNLNQADVDKIRYRRTMSAAAAMQVVGLIHNEEPRVTAGMALPAVVVDAFIPNPLYWPHYNLKVWLNGDDDYWVTGVLHADELGQQGRWMER